MAQHERKFRGVNAHPGAVVRHFSRLGGIENPVDELLHALKLVHVDQLAGDGTGQPALGDLLRFRGLAGGGDLDAGELGKHGGEGALAAVADVVVAGERYLGLAELGEDLDDQGKTGQPG